MEKNSILSKNILLIFIHSRAYQLPKEEYINKKKQHNNLNNNNKIKNNFDYNYNNYEFYNLLPVTNSECKYNTINNFIDMNFQNSLFLMNENINQSLFYDNSFIKNHTNSYYDNKINKVIKSNINNSHSQESNSSYLSTTSEGGEQNNNNFCSQKDKNLNELIKKGLKNIANYYNSNKNKKNNVSLSCNYYCNIVNEKENEYNLQIQIQNLVDNYKELEKIYNKNEIKKKDD